MPINKASDNITLKIHNNITPLQPDRGEVINIFSDTSTADADVKTAEKTVKLVNDDFFYSITAEELDIEANLADTLKELKINKEDIQPASLEFLQKHPDIAEKLLYF